MCIRDSYTAGLRGRKSMSYEGGIRAQSFWRGPGLEPKKVDRIAAHIDLAPTLCDIAGCKLGPYPNGRLRPDGVSLTRLLIGKRSELDRRVVLTSYLDTGHRVPTYWSVTTTGASPLAGKACSKAGKGGCRWMYTEYATGETELYDLSNGPCHAWRKSRKGDPCMLENKAGKPRFATVERQLGRELDRLRGRRTLFLSGRPQ